MKKVITYILLIVTVTVFAQFKEIDTLSIDERKRSKVLDFTKNSLSTCNDGKFIELDNKTAEKSMLKWYSKSRLDESCNWLNERYGKEDTIQLIKVLQDKNKNLIFRYKVKREKSDDFHETRTFVSFRGKYYGFLNKIFWSEKYIDKEIPTVFMHSLKEVSKERQNKLLDFAFKAYSNCDIKDMPEFNSSNAEYRSVRKGFALLQVNECDSIKFKNGNFKNLKLEQYLSDDVYSKIYRFKVQFDKLSKPSEIRIYTNLKGKYRGIFVIDKWYAKFHPFKEAVRNSEMDLIGEK